ncbi:MAG: hypothetical protein ACT4P4_26355 [Betaproteobacteria bacterium]
MLLALFPLVASANEQEIRRALIERDQRSAEFARRALEAFHQRQLAGEPRDREREAREREAFVLTLPAENKSGSDPDYRPSALPGRPAGAVDPIPLQRGGG